MFLRASLYYQRCVLRNRAAALLRRLRQPKYVIGLLLTVTYFGWLLVWNPAFEGNGERSADEVRGNTALVAICFYVLQVVVVWFSSSSGRGVAFREAEVQFLFPRPLTRWQILLFKWWTVQPGTLFGSLFIGLLFQRFGDLEYGFAVAGFWLIQMVLYAHGTLVGLWLAHEKSQGGIRARWTSLPAWTLLLLLAAGVALGMPHVGDATGWAAARALLDSPFLATVLSPVRSLVDLMLAPDPGSFARAAIVPLVLLAAHAWLLWFCNFRFEDQAVEIAQKIQNLKSEGLGALDTKPRVVAGPRQPWRLAPTGPAWKALVWKNVISFGRLPRRIAVRVGIILLILAAVFGGMFATEGDAPHIPTRIGFVLAGLLLYASLLAPSLVRVDLRIDIPHFDVLKAMPLRGRSLLLGEILGSVVVIWAIQAIVCAIAVVLITREGEFRFGWADKPPALIGALAVLFALDVALVASENLMALWLPGFVRLGRGVQTGFDRMGQNLMGALIRLLGLMVLFVIPAFAGAFGGMFAHYCGLEPIPASAVGGLLFAALVAAEAWLLVLLSEGRYERFDISSEIVSDDPA